MHNILNKKSICIIAGIDSSNGAGITRDIITAYDHDIHAVAITTALTAQNSYGVSHIESTSIANIEATISSVIKNDTPNLSAFKIGMLANIEITKKIRSFLADYLKEKKIPIVLDPVIYSTNGDQLLEEDAIEELKKLMKFATLITPNYLEAHKLLNINYKKQLSITDLAKKLFEKYNKTFLVKGGDKEGEFIEDILIEENNGKAEYVTYRHTRFNANKKIVQGEKIRLHGTGCMLSTTIACYLAKGFSLQLSIPSSITYLLEKIHNSQKIMKNDLFYLL